MLASLAKALEFNAEEVKECKAKVRTMEKQNEQISKENTELKLRLREQERYRMRWCLRIKGMEEKMDEDIRTTFVQILGQIVPDMSAKLEDAIDVVHRLGKKMDKKHRHVVVLFSQRRVKEEIWKKSKNSTVSKEKGISFAEMLPKEDWEDRQRLWPQIEQARRAGKIAYFRGPFGYTDGRRIGSDG